ncbi:carbon storage regulator CsrA [Mahella sp.]|uniref:carbon storage regulator CsrA n=1 Tax=Mahella sp. TaxID=2798721 RepID=UPI0025BBF059|nr:carbon storage regulator CsrA [Mahella sp.]MBZ4665778.1 carbon storage regulator, CsrA [Mahella sp.]MDK2903474.1 carbon storage regulator [Clostridiales bacterium]
MLVLTRKVEQSIKIGDDIEITVLGIDEDKVSIGIIAPKSMPIYRKEIYLQIQEANIQAAKSDPQRLKTWLKTKHD